MDDQINNMKQTFSLSDIEFLSSLPGPNSYFEGPIDEFPNEYNYHHHHHHHLDTNFPGLFDELLLTQPQLLNDRKRKATDHDVITSAFSSPHVSHNYNNNNNNVMTRKTKRVGKGKKEKEEEEEEKAGRDVVHVRARRGQATDSHSLAERDRRRKINERLRCLQDIVPGCYKSMGMAVMLDEIINYVQSLQSQVEFLSTRLAVASTFYGFNPDTNYAMETMQGFRAKAIEDIAAIQEFQSAQFALNFGNGPQLPHNL